MLGISAGKIGEEFSVDLVRAVVSQREIKSSEEIVEIEYAVDLSVDMHVAAMKAARPGVTEAQVAARVAQIALEKDCNIAFLV